MAIAKSSKWKVSKIRFSLLHFSICLPPQNSSYFILNKIIHKCVNYVMLGSWHCDMVSPASALILTVTSLRNVHFSKRLLCLPFSLVKHCLEVFMVKSNMLVLEIIVSSSMSPFQISRFSIPPFFNFLRIKSPVFPLASLGVEKANYNLILHQLYSFWIKLNIKKALRCEGNR